MQNWEGALLYRQKITQPYSKHCPLYALSLHVAEVRKTVGGPGEKASGERALKKAIISMEVCVCVFSCLVMSNILQPHGW